MDETTQQAHVAAIVFPFGSHPAQVLNVVRKLASEAPSITFSFFGTAKSNQSLFGPSDVCPSFDNIKVYNVDDGVPENHILSRSPIEEIEFFTRAAPDNMKKAIEEAVEDTNKKITCVMNDAFLWMCGGIAEELGAAWIPVWAPGASSLSAHFHTDLIRENVQGPEDNKLLDFIPGMSSVRPCDLPQELLGDLESVFPHMVRMAGVTIPRATAVVINSFEQLEYAIVEDLKSKLKLCLTIGPLTLVTPSQSALADDVYECIPWLDNREPTSVAYVSFGTSATLPPQEIAALAEGLEASGVPFLWSLKDWAKVHLPEGFLERTSERGKVVPWAPQTKILEHPAVGVNITHCGWNSVLESIMSGVPIIYRPFFGDHMLIGRFVDTIWEIGVNAGDGVFTKDDTIKGLDLILQKEEGKKIRQNAKALKEQGREAIGPTGSTTKNINTLLEMVTKN